MVQTGRLLRTLREIAMRMPSIPRKWLRPPSRIALLLGLGAFSAAGARADTGAVGAGDAPLPVPQQSAKTFGDLLIWNQGGRIFVAEPGKEAAQLPLGDTAEARRLRLLLEQDGATAAAPRALRDRIILVGSGGEGFHWAPVRQPDGPSKANGNGAAMPAPETQPNLGVTTPAQVRPAPRPGAGGAGDPRK
jgi:hypothetical protein